MNTQKEKPQYVAKKELKQQQAELEAYMQKPGFQHTLTSQKNDVAKQLTQVKQAQKQKGEIDPAFRLNKNYRKGSADHEA